MAAKIVLLCQRNENEKENEDENEDEEGAVCAILAKCSQIVHWQ